MRRHEHRRRGRPVLERAAHRAVGASRSTRRRSPRWPQRSGLSGPEAVTCDVLTARYTNLCRASDYPGACVADGAGGFVTWDCTCNYGGIARIATVLRSERASAARSLHLDSGDCFQGAPVFNVFDGEAEIRALSAHRPRRRGARQPRVRQGRHQPANQIDNWALVPDPRRQLRVRADPSDSVQAVARHDRPAVHHLQRRRPARSASSAWATSRRSRRLRGRQLARRPPARRPRQVAAPVRRAPAAAGRPARRRLAPRPRRGRGRRGRTRSAATRPRTQSDARLRRASTSSSAATSTSCSTRPSIIPQLDARRQADRAHTVLVHSGAFAKYVGRLDLVVHVGDPDGRPAEQQRSRVTSYTYDLIPVDDAHPRRRRHAAACSSPTEIKLNRVARPHQDLRRRPVLARRRPAAEDRAQRHPRRRLAARQPGRRRRCGCASASRPTSRSPTRSASAPTSSTGALTLEQMYNVFPFENTITTMFLSGGEVQEMLDFVARRARRARLPHAGAGLGHRLRHGVPPRLGLHDPTLPSRAPSPRTAATPATSSATRRAVPQEGRLRRRDLHRRRLQRVRPDGPDSSCCDRPDLGLACKCQPLNPVRRPTRWR